MREAKRRWTVRGFDEFGDVHSFSSDDFETVATMAEQMSEDLTDITIIDRHGQACAY
jgi:hypothetical protein